MPWPAAGLILEARGDREASERILGQVYEIERTRRTSTALSPLIVGTLLLRDETRAARARLDEVLGRDGVPDNLPLLQLAEAELLAAEGRWEELGELAAAMRRVGQSSGARYLAPAADRAQGRVAAARGEPAEAMRLLEGAAAGYDEVCMAVDAAVARLDAAEVARAGGLHADARRLAEAAAGPVRVAGFRREVARADALLGA
jgi:hypothetical protein